MKYTTDGKYTVKAGKIIIAQSYVGNDGYEVRVLQGVNREEVMDKIRMECPAFLEANNIPDNYSPKLF